jgi:Tfp pilus assembly PilM family ATPase
MAAEVRTSLAYLASQYQDALVKRLLMVGGGACIRGLQGFLAARLGLEVRIVNPGDLGLPLETVDATYGPSWIPALGLAQYPRRADG